MLKDIRWRFNHIVGPLFGILLFTYFVYHSIQGQHGILAWRQLDIHITKAEVTFSDLQGAEKITVGNALRGEIEAVLSH